MRTSTWCSCTHHSQAAQCPDRRSTGISGSNEEFWPLVAPLLPLGLFVVGPWPEVV